MKDFLGQELAEFDYVSGIYSNNEIPAIFQIARLTPTKCKLILLSRRDTAIAKYEPIFKFPYDLIKLDNDDVNRWIDKEPLDYFLRCLEVGDFVLAAHGEYKYPVIFEIEAFEPNVAIVKTVYGNAFIENLCRYTNDLIKIEPSLVTMYLLTEK